MHSMELGADVLEKIHIVLVDKRRENENVKAKFKNLLISITLTLRNAQQSPNSIIPVLHKTCLKSGVSDHVLSRPATSRRQAGAGHKSQI